MRDWNSITYDRYLTNDTLKNKVGLGILDLSRDIPSEFVRKRTFDMTFWMCNQTLKMNHGTYRGFSDKVEDILENSLSKGDDICIIQAQGMMSLRLAHIVTKSSEYFLNNPDKFVIAHIMNRKDRYPGLHRQLLIVNLKVWEQLGKPAYKEGGHYWDRKFRGINYTVSDNKITSDYTPEYITTNDNTVGEYSTTEDGSNWVDLCLRNNISIDNLDLEMRECKCFLYPYDETEKLEKVWNNLQDQELVDSFNNYSTRAWIRKLSYQEHIEKNRVYAFNTERLSAEGVRSPGPIDVLFSAAAGFKPLALLRNNQFHEGTVVHYYDWCNSSLNFKKHLIESWDGLDFDKWLLEHDLEYNFSSTYRGNYTEFWIKELTNEFGSREEFKELWDRYRKLEHHYHVVDLVNSPEQLTDMINNSTGNVVLWTTNIWASMQLHWMFEPEYLEQQYLKFQSQLPKTLIVYGQDYLAREIQVRLHNDYNITHPRYESTNKYISMGI